MFKASTKFCHLRALGKMGTGTVIISEGSLKAERNIHIIGKADTKRPTKTITEETRISINFFRFNYFHSYYVGPLSLKSHI